MSIYIGILISCVDDLSVSLDIGILISCVDDLSMSIGAFDLLRSPQVLFHIAFVIFSALWS